MERPITGFHQDEEGHWVAELECGHNPHVHHDPPWECRPWGRDCGELTMTIDAHFSGVRHPALPALPLSRPRPARGPADHPSLRALALHPGHGAHRRAGGRARMLTVIGCSFRNTPVAVREHLAFDGPKLARALDELNVRYGCEAVVLGTCNRVELYLARPEGTFLPDADLIAEFLSEYHRLPALEIRPHLYEARDGEAVRHLFRVAASLDSLIVGEAQIAGQVKGAYELAHERATAGPLLHALFQQAHRVAKRVRTETGIARGRVSVSSAAVDYVRQVFDHFGDKTVLVIGAGKMGELTLWHLKELRPRRILVTNRRPEKAAAVARGCGGEPVPRERLDDALARADIVLSTTGAPEPVVTLERFRQVSGRRTRGTMVILDIAVPRDFDPRIHDGDRTCLFNIDNLKRIREETLRQ